MTEWRQLFRWLRRAQPPSGPLAVAVLTALFATLTGSALSIGAPFLLVLSVARGRAVTFTTVAIVLAFVELFAFLRAPSRFAERTAGHDLAERAVSTWRSWLLRSVGAWPYQRWREAATGDLLDRALADTDALQSLWLEVAVPGVAAMVGALAIDVFVGFADPSSGPVIAAVLCGLEVVSAVALTSSLPSLARLERRVRLARAKRISEQVSWTEVDTELTLLGRSDVGQARLSRATSYVAQAERARDRAVRWRTVLVMGWPLVALVTTYSLLGHADSRASLLALLGAIVAGQCVSDLAASVVAASTLTVATERLDELAPATAAGTQPCNPRPSLTAEGLRYEIGGTPVLRGVNVSVGDRRRVAITGAIGSGKSTLLRLLAALDDPSGGRVAVDGVPTALVDPGDLHRAIAYQSASPLLLEGPADRALWSRRAPGTDPEAALRDLGVPVTNDGRLEHLSSGEARRAALARTLIGAPAIAVLDEPTAGLDDHSRDLVLRALTKFPGALVMATHDDAVIALCDESFELANGSLHPTSTTAPPP